MGQVVIPKKERDKVGIKPGSKVVVEVVNDHIMSTTNVLLAFSA